MAKQSSVAGANISVISDKVQGSNAQPQEEIIAQASRGSPAKVPDNVKSDIYFDAEGNRLVSAQSLFKNVAPAISTHVHTHQAPVVHEVNVCGVESDGNKLLDEVPGVFVPARSLFPDIDLPMWNFSSQSPVCDHSDVPSTDNVAADGGPSEPAQRPAGAMTGTACVGGVGLSDVDTHGDLFHVFESDELVPLSWDPPTADGNILISHFSCIVSTAFFILISCTVDPFLLFFFFG